ncbi:MAG: AgmX/PglI C-terminal domain-containing protein, partial [Deltaproteobacteria bacterium]|nr:AgmX/PglI C-terminal domain-containing protein [Deltaproteobacteria bacterium]
GELAAEPIIRPDDRLLRVAILWNNKILKETTFKIKRPIYIGEGIRSDFVIPHADLPKKYPLFVVDNKGNYLIGLRKDFNGHVTVNGVYETIPQYIKKHTSDTSGSNYVSINPGDWGLVEFSETSLFFQFVKPAIVIARRPFMALDGQFFATTAVSAVGVFVFLLFSVFMWNESAAMKGKKDDKRYLKVDVEITQEKDEDLLQIGEEEDTVGKKAEGEEGKFGDPDEDPLKESKVPKRDGKMVSKIDPKQIGLNDLLNTNKLGRNSAISSILSDDADMFSNKIAVAMAGTGSELVIGHGAGGMGFKGTGPGGGGTGGYGRIHGLGKVDTGGGLGVRANLGKKAQAKVGSVSLGSGSSTGFCQKSNIQKVVMQRAAAIRSCYEAQLQIYPDLGGKVTTRWTINMEGGVDGESILNSTLGNTAVEQCILRG